MRLTCYRILDERIIEYDIDEIVFEKRSPFQKIQIVHSKTLGNMLILDELQSKYLYISSTLVHNYLKYLGLALDILLKVT